MATTPKTPTTLQEAEAAEKAIAAFYLTRVQAAEAVMNSPEAQAFEAKVAELLADGLPAGTSCNVNLPAVAQWFAEVKQGIEADRASLDRIVNPPATEPAADETEERSPA